MEMATLDDKARAILRGNDRGGYTLPTAGLYPYQWHPTPEGQNLG